MAQRRESHFGLVCITSTEECRYRTITRTRFLQLKLKEQHLDRNHSESITEFPPCFKNAPWIEVEARGKERAIAALLEKQAAAVAPSV